MTAGPAWLQRFDVAGAGTEPRPPGPRVAVKDAIDVAGTVTTVGSRARHDAAPAVVDAPCVSAIRRAGGRILGKTNLAELCWSADGGNDVTGTPANPLDPRRIPGGSSSGSAVAVALGEADLALGTDTGGSVRIPAAACGVAGLKTTRGRIPLDGVFPLCPELDTVGPLARDLPGLVLGMSLLDPSFAVDQHPPTEPVVARLRLPGLPVSPEVDAAVDTALDRARWRTADLVVPDWLELAAGSSRILTLGAGPAQEHLLARADLLSAGVRQNIEAARRMKPGDVVAERRLLAALGEVLSAALHRHDAVVLPTLAQAPPLLGQVTDWDLTWLTVPFNVLGWPVVSLPVAAPGTYGPVPPSMQIVGLPGSEGRLLALAAGLSRPG